MDTLITEEKKLENNIKDSRLLFEEEQGCVA